jgi:hypothetical protein
MPWHPRVPGSLGAVTAEEGAYWEAPASDSERRPKNIAVLRNSNRCTGGGLDSAGVSEFLCARRLMGLAPRWASNCIG